VDFLSAMDAQLRQSFDLFFRQHEQSALKMSIALTRQREDALEIVQDSMLNLVQKYSHKPHAEWTLLFFRIVQNKIKDHQRKKSFRSLFHVFLPAEHDEDDDIIEQSQDHQQRSPDDHLQQSDDANGILNALNALPLRQKQTFICRAWQEFSVKETAFTLAISEGSVKTHYSRALAQLRTLLGDTYEELT